MVYTQATGSDPDLLQNTIAHHQELAARLLALSVPVACGCIDASGFEFAARYCSIE